MSYRSFAHDSLRMATSFVAMALIGTWSVLASGCSPEAGTAFGGVSLPIAPTDLALGPNGSVYVSSVAEGALFRVSGGATERVDADLPRTYGVAALADGRICVAHDTSVDPLTRRSAVSCSQDGVAWTPLVRGLGSGLNGLAVGSHGLWALGWRDTDIEQRDGLLTLVVDGEVTRQIDLPASLPQFAAELPSGDLIVSAWREDASGITGGVLMRVAPEGGAETFSDALGRPSGVAVTEDGVWAADFAAGALVLLSEGGTEIARHEGLQSPMGVAVAGSTRLCVAESQGRRITCLERAGREGGTQ